MKKQHRKKKEIEIVLPRMEKKRPRLAKFSMYDKREKEEELKRKIWSKECEAECTRKSERRELMKMLELQEFENQLLSLGYAFKPTEELLLYYYLRKKNLDEPMDIFPIKDVDVYAKHPQCLMENYQRSAENIWYFFTRSRPNEIQPSTDVQGHWTFVEKKDILCQGEKVGVKQVLEYCEGGHKSEYKIIDYELNPAEDCLKTTGLWFICKLYNDGGCVDAQSPT